MDKGKKIDISVRPTADYDECINDIGDLIANKYSFTEIEAYGVLEAVKLEIFTVMQQEQ